MNERPPSDRAEKIIVRLPDGMRGRLAAVAKANKRSVNAEVVARLEQSFEPLVALGESSNEEIIASIKRILAADKDQKAKAP